MILEHSVEEFAQRFAGRANAVALYPQPLGSPLLEFCAGGLVLYLFDRTGPQVASGAAKVIVHPLLRWLERIPPQDAPELACSAISALSGSGQVEAAERGFLIVQSQLLLVCGLLEGGEPAASPGDWVRFTSHAPVHGFVV